jgi:hypothetical protein
VVGEGVGGGMKKCVHMYVNAKMIPIETVPEIWRGRMKERSGGGEFKYGIFDALYKSL